MSESRLREEIRQNRPFRSLYQEALLSIERTSAVLGHSLAESLREYGITPTQYNVLRILRGAGESGLCRHEVRDRMVTPVPDVTRLLDRLEDAGLIVRERSQADRRQVRTSITESGMELLARLDGPVDEHERGLLGHMSDTELRQLIELLSRARSRAPAASPPSS